MPDVKKSQTSGNTCIISACISAYAQKLILRGEEREAFSSPETASLLVSTNNRDLWEVQFSEHAQSNGPKTMGMRLDGQNLVISKWLLPELLFDISLDKGNEGSGIFNLGLCPSKNNYLILEYSSS